MGAALHTAKFEPPKLNDHHNLLAISVLAASKSFQRRTKAMKENAQDHGSSLTSPPFISDKQVSSGHQDNHQDNGTKSEIFHAVELMLIKSQQELVSLAYEQAIEISASAIRLLSAIPVKNNEYVHLFSAHSYILARCRQRMGHIEQAINECRAALLLHSQQIQLRQLLDECQRGQRLKPLVEHLIEGIEEAKHDLNKNGESEATLHLQLAKQHQHRGEYVPASIQYVEVLKLSPSRMTDEVDFIHVLRVDNHLLEMVNLLFTNSMFNKVREIMDAPYCNDNVRVYIQDCFEDELRKHQSQGMRHFINFNYSMAIKHLTVAIGLMQNLPSHDHNHQFKLGAILYSSRATCFIKLREYERALDDCSSALTLSPRYVQAWVNKLKCLEAIGDFTEYSRAVSDSIKLFGESEPQITELTARTLSSKPIESAEAGVVTSEDVFV
jgi:tetratricopeptide (TPR) repeat protein